MHCELVIPGLLASRARHASLELLAARGRRIKATPQPTESWLQQAFGLSGRLNAGPISVLGAGGTPGDATWTRADPVYMQILRERVLLVPAATFHVPREEADALCDALNRHFAGALEFRALDPHRWCARLLQGDMDFGDEPPLEMAGREATSRPGDVMLTEVQMLLHSQPVNEAREARGEPPLNSVWLWGAGRLPQTASSRFQSVTSADPFPLGLARLAGASARALPAAAAVWLAQAQEDARHLVILDTAAGAETLERDWFAPLAAALRAGRVGMLSLHVPDAGFSVETVRGDLRRFWRRAKALVLCT
jgi:hypothetical protein